MDTVRTETAVNVYNEPKPSLDTSIPNVSTICGDESLDMNLINNSDLMRMTFNSTTAYESDRQLNNNSPIKTNKNHNNCERISTPDKIASPEIGTIESKLIKSENIDDSSSISNDNNNSIIMMSSSACSKEIANKKKIYHCDLCKKKYATMTNIYKHMRSHNLYLCSLCMKTFSQEHEIKEHKCPHGSVKTPQCSVCFKYLSNSWSLTRHMKIHTNDKDFGDGIDEFNSSTTELQIKSETTTDTSCSEPPPPTPNQMHHRNTSAETIHKVGVEFSVTVQENSDYSEATSCSLATTCSSADLSQTIEHEPNTIGLIDDSDDLLFECTICTKSFNSKNRLSKHMTSVHTGIKIIYYI